jgi:hypothetical protein
MSDHFEVCMADEKRARDQLAQGWASFDAGTRTRCARMSTTGQASSYIELLTCLEMDQTAKKLPSHDGTGGMLFTAPERPLSERDEVAEPSQAPAPSAQPRQQGVAAVPPPAVRTPSPGPVTISPPPLSSAAPAPSQPSPQPVSQDEARHQSVCRSPLGYILPNCR